MKPPPLVALIASAMLIACPSARAAAAAENWTQSCASCHGSDGAGKTKMGRKVGAKDLTDAAYQKSFSDEELFKHLKEGESGPDGKVRMKAYGDQLTGDEIKALVGFVRSLAK